MVLVFFVCLLYNNFVNTMLYYYCYILNATLTNKLTYFYLLLILLKQRRCPGENEKQISKQSGLQFRKGQSRKYGLRPYGKMGHRPGKCLFSEYTNTHKPLLIKNTFLLD